MPGVERTAIYRIHPDHTVETIWTSQEENVFDLAFRNGSLVFSTDQRGRLYSLGSDLKATLLAETQEGETTRLAAHDKSIYAATANLGKLFRLNGADQPAGSYESAVHDAGNVARWGRLDWTGSPESGAFRLPDPLRQLRPPRSHLERMVRPPRQSRGRPYRQPQCPLHPVES
jgi:hypothetical protein